jgi:tetratricopeptide (TPR) repeat protein
MKEMFMTSKFTLVGIAALLWAAIATTQPVLAADDFHGPQAGGKAQAAEPLASVRDLIKQERWRDAIAELQKINLANNADWHNLMGYSHRKAKAPDYAAAQQHYDAALRLQPQHRGALEYSGELFLMKGEVAQAKGRLASLEAACGRDCAEYQQLQTAITTYEAGKR